MKTVYKDIYSNDHYCLGYDGEAGAYEIVQNTDTWLCDDDQEAVTMAEQDGIKFIPINDIPEGFPWRYKGWVDTPANRIGIEWYCEGKKRGERRMLTTSVLWMYKDGFPEFFTEEEINDGNGVFVYLPTNVMAQWYEENKEPGDPDLETWYYESSEADNAYGLIYWLKEHGFEFVQDPITKEMVAMEKESNNEAEKV